mmetsp:Transcript_11818/g.16889  ORF Transcript_11818/g.16889 Transcript_11818/m.16889 type:complete len:465 (+) Transcript_11818:125-1519(+)
MTILLAAVLLSCVGVQGSKHVEKQAEVSVGAHHFKALQVGTTPKITSVDNLGSDKFAIYVTFATCAVGLTTDDFTFSDDFTIRDLSLQEIAPGVQFRLEGTFLPKPGANIPTSGVDVGVTLKSGAVSFVDSFTGRGVGNVVTFGSFRYNPPASSFFETTVAEVTATPSKHVSFTVTYGSLCTLSTVNPFKEGHFFSAAFSVSNEGQRPATLESAVVTHVQGMTSINVQVSTPYTDDVVTLTANAGGCVAAGGAINREAKATAVVSTAGATCGPWTAFDTSLCGTCSRYSDTFQLMSGQKCRRRESQPGRVCAVTTECRDCTGLPVCEDNGSRPYAGETLLECAGCLDTGYRGAVQASGCSCSADCQVTANCCQDFYRRGCAGQGSRQKPQFLAGFSPPLCTFADCQSTQSLTVPGFPSFFCFCHPNCASADGTSDQCCGGASSRNLICTGNTNSRFVEPPVQRG